MNVFRKLFDSKYFKKQHLYYFINPELNSDEPHFHVCIAKDKIDVYFLICSSQFKTKERFIKMNNLPYSTLVYIDSYKQSDNDLTKQTYISCNECFKFSIDELYQMKENGILLEKGKISNSNMQQLSIGFNESRLIDNHLKPKFPKID